MNLAALLDVLRDSRGFAHKRDIALVMAALRRHLPDHDGGGGVGTDTVAGAGGSGSGCIGTDDRRPTIGGTQVAGAQAAIGDDCAVIPDGDGHLLFAIEGLVEDFVRAMPWFAGYSAVMVNLSDVAAMGGRPIAVVDAIWSDGVEAAEQVLAGMAAASRQYGVPIVGGHSNYRSPRAQLAVAVLGRAQALLSSFAARAGDHLLMVVDLRGVWRDPFPFWDASSSAPATRLRGDLALLAELAEDGLCDAAKDISMAGVLGTALMLLECSQVGAEIDLAAIPHPQAPSGSALDEAAWQRWLTAFPSYGYLLSVRPERVEAVRRRFAARDLACQSIGRVTTGTRVDVRCAAWDAGNHRDADGRPDGQDQTETLWDFAQHSFILAEACDA